MVKSSRISGFYKMSVAERLKIVAEQAGLTDDEVQALSKTGALSLEAADRMIENVVGTTEYPLGIACNFLIDGKEYLVPMALEEPSVVAAASNMAKVARAKGGFFTSATEPVMIGQIQITDVSDPYFVKQTILSHKKEIVELANKQDPVLVKFGGGARDVSVRVLDSIVGPMVVVHLMVDCRDAMGANAVNTMVEACKPMIEELSRGNVILRIITNLAKFRIARSRAVFDKKALGGKEAVERIIKVYALALADPYRCSTHNKGIMNGIDAVVVATCNDFRAVEAGAHTYAAMSGEYKPLTKWEKNKDGDLVGTIELPIAVGIIGGATSVHPVAKVARKILDVKSASELARVMVSVGLAQNLGALRAIAMEGIQSGHMSLHARNIAQMAGATGEMIDKVVEIIVREKNVRMDRAKEVLDDLRGQ
ncbi:MAG: hydroxymethylglutaryl-CoA reductase, degradative [archaeon]